MTYFEWESLPEAERIERCAKALRWHKLGAFWVDQANNVMADLERKGEWDGWDPLRSRDDCAALIEAVANHSPSAVVAFSAALATSDLEYTESAAMAWCASHWLALFCAAPDLLAWAACEALLEGHD